MAEALGMPDLDVRPEHWEMTRQILLKNVPEYEVWAFGSRVCRTAKPFSDLDLVVITAEALPREISASLASDFSESDLPWKVDILDWSLVAENFRDIIRKQHVVLQRASKEVE